MRLTWRVLIVLFALTLSITASRTVAGGGIATDARSIGSEQDDALESAYQDGFAKHMIVAANPAQVPQNFSGTVSSSEEEKADALDRRMNDVYDAVRFVPAA